MTNKAPVEGLLGQRLKEAREYRGLALDDVAQHIGVSHATLSLMENSRRNVSAVELGQLAKLYKTTAESLAGYGSSDDESINTLAQATSTLSDKDREEVIRFAKYLRARSTNEPA